MLQYLALHITLALSFTNLRSVMSLNSSVQVVVHVGERELLTSGVIHLEGSDPVTITVANLKFIFDFKTDDAGPRYTGTFKDQALYLDLYNHKNSLGEGKLTPIEIAQVGTRPLSVTYYASTVNADTSARRFEYAFYLGAAK